MKSFETTTQWIEKILSQPGFAAIANHAVIEFSGGHLQTLKGEPEAPQVLVYIYQPNIPEPNSLEEMELKSEYTIEKSEPEYSLEKETEFVGEYILSIVRRKKDFRLVMADLQQMGIFNSHGKFQEKYRNTKLISGVILKLFDQKYFYETDADGHAITLVTVMHAFEKQFIIKSLQPIYRCASDCMEYADLKVPIIGILKLEKSRNNLTL